MIDGPAYLLDHLGAGVCTALQQWMPALGFNPTTIAVRATASMVLLMMSGLAAWVVLIILARLLSLVPSAWREAVRAAMPSLRLIALVLVVAVSLAPFLWQPPVADATSDAAPVATASLAALITVWLTTAVVIIALGNLLFRLVHAVGEVARRRAEHTTSAWDDVLIEVTVRVLLGFIILGTVYVAIAVLADHPVLTETTAHLLGLLVIALISWAMMNLVHLVDRFLMTRFNANSSDNLRARRVATQVVVLRRLAYLVIAIFAISTALMQFEAIRHVGASILASAGLAGVVLGFAAQRTLGNVLAGIQIALTQPLRIDDSVLIENEFGKVEEITLTYVVVGLWDQRRLIVPLSRIIENSFQNWTRTSTELLGTVSLRCAYTVPVAELRTEAERYLDTHRLWDHRARAVQVTDCDHRTMEVRILVSAASAGALFDLRCEVREHLLVWLRSAHPDALPHVVLAQVDGDQPPIGERRPGADARVDGNHQQVPANAPL